MLFLTSTCVCLQFQWNRKYLYVAILKLRVKTFSISAINGNYDGQVLPQWDLIVWISFCTWTFTAWKVPRYGVFSCPYFLAFGLNTERYRVSLRIQSEYRKIRTRKTPNADTFHSVLTRFFNSVFPIFSPGFKISGLSMGQFLVKFLVLNLHCSTKYTNTSASIGKSFSNF